MKIDKFYHRGSTLCIDSGKRKFYKHLSPSQWRHMGTYVDLEGIKRGEFDPKQWSELATKKKQG